MGTKFRNRDIPLVAQLQRMLALDEFTAYIRRHSCLVAYGEVQPTPLSKIYRIRIEYPQGGKPDVWVQDPLLERRSADERIPHMYDQERLCLYYPGSGEWTRRMFVADTIVPWAAEWLHYYELWHLTGQWHGGGREPRDGVTYRNHDQEVFHGGPGGRRWR